MNYRHVYHAGNFADVMKHAILLHILADRAEAKRLTVIDTHAGAGLYDLTDEAARASGEAERGVGRLMADLEPPSALLPLITAVRSANAHGALRWYPGSPRLICQALRDGDHYIGCELRADDHAHLLQTEGVRTGRNAPHIELRLSDGYLQAKALLAREAGPMLLVIDPPFERGDEYEAVLDLLGQMALRPNAAAAVVWLPIKDLQTFDRFLTGVAAAGHADAVVAEVRLRPLDNPLRLNGCALVLINTPDVVQAALSICAWTAAAAGEAGGLAQVCDLNGARLI